MSYFWSRQRKTKETFVTLTELWIGEVKTQKRKFWNSWGNWSKKYMLDGVNLDFLRCGNAVLDV